MKKKFSQKFVIAISIIAIIFFGVQCKSTKNTTSSNINDDQKFKFVKVSRDVKKERRRYSNAGWVIFPGNLPIENQLDLAFRRQSETDNQGFPQWIIANGSSVAQTQAAAEMQSIELAKNRLVGLIETNMKAVIESDVANNQISEEDAVSVTKSIEVSANRVAKKLSRVQPLFKVYRKINDNIEVQVLLGYNYDLVKKQLLDEARAELQLETDDVRKRYEKFLNPENFQRGTILNYLDDASQE